MRKIIVQFCNWLWPGAPAVALLSGCAFTNPPPLPPENPTNPQVGESAPPQKSLLVADATTRAISERLKQVPAEAKMPAMEDGGMQHEGMQHEEMKHSESSQEQQKGAGAYTCPMHPEIKSEKPGTCPKCGMELVKKGGVHEGQ
jgi:Heavy metal binding domain